MVKEKLKWTDETIIAELKSIAAKIGHFPTSGELRDLKPDLDAQIPRHGGINKFRTALGVSVIRKRNFWTEERILIELKTAIEKIGHFPTSRELRKNKCSDLDGQITLHGGLNGYRLLLGYELPQKPVGYWTEDRALTELKIFISEIGHFPKRDEFIAKKKEDLEAALKKYGGTNEFRKLLGYELIQQSAGYWTEDVIISKLKQAIADIGNFPVREELDEYGVGGLSAAIDHHGGLNRFRILMGHELSRKPPNYWDYENTLKELKNVIEKIDISPHKENSEIWATRL